MLFLKFRKKLYFCPKNKMESDSFSFCSMLFVKRVSCIKLFTSGVSRWIIIAFFFSLMNTP